MTERLVMFVPQMSVTLSAIQLKERNVVGESVLGTPMPSLQD
jgi:hypothetical protein